MYHPPISSISRTIICPNIFRTALLSNRTIHSSLPRSASEIPTSTSGNPLADPTVRDFYEKIKKHQGAQEAMANIGKLMESKGFDMSKPPSTMQMMKMGLDKELRDAGMKLMEELKNAGIDINPENAAAIMAKMRPSE